MRAAHSIFGDFVIAFITCLSAEIEEVLGQAVQIPFYIFIACLGRVIFKSGPCLPRAAWLWQDSALLDSLKTLRGVSATFEND